MAMPLVRNGRKERLADFRGFRNRPVWASRTISIRDPKPGPEILTFSAIFASFAVKCLG
jgi:hypothetical protein